MVGTGPDYQLLAMAGVAGLAVRVEGTLLWDEAVVLVAQTADVSGGLFDALAECRQVAFGSGGRGGPGGSVDALGRCQQRECRRECVGGYPFPGGAGTCVPLLGGA